LQILVEGVELENALEQGLGRLLLRIEEEEEREEEGEGEGEGEEKEGKEGREDEGQWMMREAVLFAVQVWKRRSKGGTGRKGRKGGKKGRREEGRDRGREVGDTTLPARNAPAPPRSWQPGPRSLPAPAAECTCLQ